MSGVSVPEPGSEPEQVPEPIVDAYQLTSARPIAGGLINATFIAERDHREPLVIQRLHPIFAAEVNLDIEAITEHLAARGVDTPRLVRTRGGDRWVTVGDQVWRALTFIPGETVDHIADPELARAAGELVGRFHAALADCDHTFAFARSGVHDTSAHLAKLKRLASGDYEGAWVAETRDLAQAIGDAAARRPHWPTLPEQITHGDLKISNVRFASTNPPRARCLIDLDTLGRLTLPYELGDALRSWCNRAEDKSPRFSSAIARAALVGYVSGRGPLESHAALEAVPAGALVVSIELAARFCADVFEDSYFGWDAERYPSRRAHNLARARSQLTLAHQIEGELADLEAAVKDLLTGARRA